MATMRFAYTIGEAGWANAHIECGDSVVDMTASYLHDSLRDLLSATTAIVRGAREASAIFMDEPGEHHLNLRRLGAEKIEIEVLWYSDWHSRGTGSSIPSAVLRCETRVAHLRGQVLSAARQIIDQLGAAGYRSKWQKHDFPLQQLAELESAVL
jgi:hypothetical protein